MKIPILRILGMYLRKAPVRAIKNAATKADEAGLQISLDSLEAHSLAGGDIEAVVDALIFAKQHNLKADFMLFSAINLVGHNPFELVKRASVSETLKVPCENKNGIEFIECNTIDNKKIRLCANVTVRINLQSFTFY